MNKQQICKAPFASFLLFPNTVQSSAIMCELDTVKLRIPLRSIQGESWAPLKLLKRNIWRDKLRKAVEKNCLVYCRQISLILLYSTMQVQLNLELIWMNWWSMWCKVQTMQHCTALKNIPEKSENLLRVLSMAASSAATETKCLCRVTGGSSVTTESSSVSDLYLCLPASSAADWWSTRPSVISSEKKLSDDLP